ncbi:MAG: GLUG motif-containing protein, partial [Planctomycetota bacterium]
MAISTADFRLALIYRRSCRAAAILLALLVLCTFARNATGVLVDNSKMPASAQADAYVFVLDQSSVVQTGGFAGVHETHRIEGQFRLVVDHDKGTASFAQVSARLTGKSSFLPAEDLGTLFNMTALVGTVAADASISFEGKTSDGTKSDIVITLTLSGDSVHLTGQTIPPAGSADFFVFSLDAVARKKYGGGTGEPDAPYLISTEEHLNSIGAAPADWDAHFKLTADIDLSSVTGTSFNIIGTNHANPFTGEFDGDGYRISDFNYTSASGDYVGLFGCVGWDGSVRNLKLIDAIVDAGKGDYVAPLAGCLMGGTVVNCSAEGSVVSGKRYVGGLVGRNTFSSGGILEMLAVGSIENSYSQGNIAGGQDIGGLVGANSGLISNCSSAANVSGTSRVGGLVGSNNHGAGLAEITKCYAVGAVDGTARVGGLAGHNNSEILDSFWDVQTSGQTASDGGNGRTTTQMQTPGTFLDAGWDLVGETANGTEDIWRACEAANYPKLTWQIQAGDFVCPDGVTVEDFV